MAACLNHSVHQSYPAVEYGIYYGVKKRAACKGKWVKTGTGYTQARTTGLHRVLVSLNPYILANLVHYYGDVDVKQRIVAASSNHLAHLSYPTAEYGI